MSDTYTTIVIKHEDGKSCPGIFAGMEALGGNIIAVQFNNALEELEKLEAKVEHLEQGWE